MNNIPDQFNETAEQFIARQIFEAMNPSPAQIIRSIEKFALLYGIFDQLDLLRECDFDGRPLTNFSRPELLEVWGHVKSWTKLDEAMDSGELAVTKE